MKLKQTLKKKDYAIVARVAKFVHAKNQQYNVIFYRVLASERSYCELPTVCASAVHTFIAMNEGTLIERCHKTVQVQSSLSYVQEQCSRYKEMSPLSSCLAPAAHTLFSSFGPCRPPLSANAAVCPVCYSCRSIFHLCSRRGRVASF